MDSRLAQQSIACGILLLVVSGSGTAQEVEASHRKRLANPVASFAREEQEADARLQVTPQDSPALRARGLARLNLGKLGEAAADLGRAATLDPLQAGVRTELAFVLLLQGRWAEALESARAALALDPGNSAANAYAGHVLLRQGELDPAILHLERAVKRIPANLDVHFDLLEAHRQKGDFSHAWVELRLLRFLLSPTDPRLIYQEGVLHADQGNLEIAITRFRATLAASPDLAGAREDLAAALIESDRAPEALEVLAPLVRGQPLSFSAAYLHALALERSKRLEEAEAEARRAMALSAHAADGHALLGTILVEAGRLGEALLELRRARELDPNHASATLHLGQVLASTGRLEEGLALLRRAVELAPRDPEAHTALGAALRLAGKHAEAAEESAVAERLEQEKRRPDPSASLAPRAPEARQP